MASHIAQARGSWLQRVRPERLPGWVFDDWLKEHEAFVAVLVASLGFLVRAWVSTGTYLDPDEALHYSLANQSSLKLAYQASLDVVHPPLLIVVLYYVRLLGTSEMILRLPSLIAGTAFCWVAYKWLARLAGKTAGWIGLIFFAFLPPLIEFSAEVRQYAPMLLFIACTLYFLERSLAEESIWMMVLSLIALYLAMLSHYSAVLLAPAIAGYVVARIATGHAPGLLTLVWGIGQLGALGFSLLFYITHLSQLERNGFAAWMRNYYLVHFYFRPHQDNAVLFLAGRTINLFQYVFGQPVVGVVALLLFVTCIVLLWRKNSELDDSPIGGRPLAIIFLLPFAIAGGAALARFYPFGGTRQCVFLAIFVISGASIGLSKLVQQRIGYGVTIAVVLVLVCNVFGRPRRPYMHRARERSEQMERAMEFVGQQISPTEPIFVDYETGILVGHYLCHQRPVPRWPLASGFEALQCEKHRIISTTAETWIFSLATFLDKWDQLVSKCHLSHGDRVWFVEYGQNLNAQLPAYLPELHEIQTRSFGPNITLFELTVW